MWSRAGRGVALRGSRLTRRRQLSQHRAVTSPASSCGRPCSRASLVSCPTTIAARRRLFATVTNPIASIGVEDGGNVMSLLSDGLDAKFHAVWLRDHCQCPACREVRTQQRAGSSLSYLKEDIKMDEVRFMERVDKLALMLSETVAPTDVHDWDQRVQATTDALASARGCVVVSTTDGHKCVLSLDFLIENSYWVGESSRAAGLGQGKWVSDREKLLAQHPPRSFTQGAFSDESTPSVRYEDVMDPGSNGLLRWLLDIHVHGFGCVTNTPITEASAEELVRRMSFPASSLYSSGMWRTEVVDGGANDTAYSTMALPAHCDGTYFETLPGLQVFHSLAHDLPRGQSLLVDGLAVCERLREENPDAFHFFATTDVPFGFMDATHDLRQHRRVITVDDKERITGFAFNDVDRRTIHLAPQDVPVFYKHLAALLSIIEDPAMEVWLGLAPGTVIAINNRRVMHGRSAFNATSGRTLVGCYIDGGEYQSRLMVEWLANQSGQ